jgi:hypothetical protein
VFGEAHSLWQDDAEAVEECGLGGIGLGDAAQADLTMGGGWQHDIVRLNSSELFEHSARGVSEPGALLPHLKTFPQHEGEKADKDMSLDAFAALVPDRAHVQLILLDTEGRFGLGELDVGLPELLIAPIADVRAQEIGALRKRNPVIERGAADNLQAKAGQLSGSSSTVKPAAARWFCCRMRPICRFTVAGSTRFFERAIRAARRSSASSIRRLNLSCIARRRAPVPIFGNVQLARWLAEPRRNQHGRHLRPCDALLAHRKRSLAQLLKARPAPQRERQIHIAEPTRALDANALQTHRRRQMFAAVVEQWRLLGSTDQSTRKCSRLNASVLIELAKMRHRLLDDAPPDAHATHQAPIAVNLTVLLANRVAQVHAPSQPPPRRKKIPKVVTLKSPSRTVQPLDPTRTTSRQIAETTPQLRKLG